MAKLTIELDQREWKKLIDLLWKGANIRNIGSPDLTDDQKFVMEKYALIKLAIRESIPGYVFR